ncbi:hypothetical protein ACSYDW_07200 [Paeniglutamicibacter sp. R2-26]|uniref:hypothetical protein n=1 Tax=Paeniglutamicibacter sp. R2-26 TaxID=3144417 RepID=UPI003EE65A9E
MAKVGASGDQLSLLDLLTEDPEPAPATTLPAPRIDPHPWCEACGEHEYMAHLMPSESARFGHPVCMGMNLTLNHISYAMGQANTHEEREPYPCCHDKHGIHGKKISKPTRQHWLDHANAYIARAQVKWKNHPMSLLAEVGELRVRHGIAPDEAPVITKVHLITE